MSHHNIHLLPGLMPLEPTVKTGKRRRLRRTRGGAAVSYAREADEVDALFAYEDGYDPLDEDFDDLLDGGHGRSALASFSGQTLKALLQAQEDR